MPYGLGYSPTDTGGPYTARYPQNAGLARGLAALQSQNAAIAARGPVAPYRPSPTDPHLSGVARYGLGLQHAAQYESPGFQGGLATNYGAGLGYANTGYMPSKTVGGGYGLANPYAGRQPGYAPYSGQGGGAGPGREGILAGINQPAVGSASAINGLAGMNPNGRWYQGATPGLGVSANGSVRPMFMGSGPTGYAPPMSEADTAKFAAARGLMVSPTGGLIGRGSIMEPAAGAYAAAPGRLMGLAAIGPNGYTGPTIAQEKQNAARQATLNRVATRRQNRLDAFQTQMEATNPEYGLAMAQMRQDAAHQQGLLGLQYAGLASRERIAESDRGLRQQAMTAQSELARAQQDLQRFTAEGNWKAAAEAQKATIAAAEAHDKVQQQIAQGEQSTRTGIANTQAASAEKIATTAHGSQKEEIQLKREQLAQQRADSLRQQANEAFQQGDILRGQQLQQMANQSMGLAGIPAPQGSQPVAATGGLAAVGPNGVVAQNGLGAPRIPLQARPAIDSVVSENKANPHALVNRLRDMGLSDQQINVELARVYGSSRLLGLTTGEYQRTADYPAGSFGWAHVNPTTGRVSYGPFGLFGGGP